MSSCGSLPGIRRYLNRGMDGEIHKNWMGKGKASVNIWRGRWTEKPRDGEIGEGGGGREWKVNESQYKSLWSCSGVVHLVFSTQQLTDRLSSFPASDTKWWPGLRIFRTATNNAPFTGWHSMWESLTSLIEKNFKYFQCNFFSYIQLQIILPCVTFLLARTGNQRWELTKMKFIWWETSYYKLHRQLVWFDLILRQDSPWFEFLVIFDFFALWYRRRWEASSVKLS